MGRKMVAFVNYYRCPKCGREWDSVWDSMCDDECGERSITPHYSEQISE